jgi:transcriptional adapter 2-alpha
VASVAAVDVTGDHEPTHGYRVSDSTRFLVFPTARDVRKSIAPNKDEAAAVAPTAAGATAPTRTRTAIVTDKPKAVWTAEEDLRLLDAISTYGLGNWDDISEAVAGTGSTSPYSSNKSARQCMERYFDDFMGRFGHILPPYTLVEDGGDGTASSSAANEDIARSNCDGLVTDKKYRAVPTSSLPGYESVWPHPHLPDIPNVKFGDEVGRDLAVRAEQEFVKATTSVQNKDDADKIREEWLKNRLRKPGGPTVLPMRMEDIHTLSGSELAGYMPRRGDFDIEWDNDAEALLANMEFSANDAPNDRQLKLQIIEIYNAKLDERERRKQFLIDRGLLDYRKNQAEDLLLPPDERDLVNRMRLFARFHSPEEHEKFVKDLLKAKRLRKEIAKLQQYRRMGLQTLREAEMYELDRERRDHHKLAHVQKEVADEKAAKAAAASTAAAASSTDHADHADAPSLGKKYGSSDCQAKMFGDRGGGATSMEIDDDGDKEPVDKFRIYDKPGYDLLSSKEIKLCEKLELLPALYIEAKKALIAESFKAGIIASGSSKASIAKIDVEKRDGVVDFVLRSGWIQRKPNLQNAAVKK